MNYAVLFSLLLAHAVSDFVFQTPEMIRKRTGDNLRRILSGNLQHLLSYLLITIVPVVIFWSGPGTLLIMFSLLLSHGAIDCLKSFYVYLRRKAKFSVMLLGLDQFLHLIAIVIASYLISQDFPGSSVIIPATADTIRFMINSVPTKVTTGEKWVLAAFLLVMGLWGAGIFIRQFLQAIIYAGKMATMSGQAGGETADGMDGIKANLPDGGFIIGILERLFIILSIVLGRQEVIGFVLATKSIARFKKFDEDCFMEYFIIGSFLSFIVAICIGVVIRGLKIIPLID